MVAPGNGHVVNHPGSHVNLFDPVTEERKLIPVFSIGQVVCLPAGFSDGQVLVKLYLNKAGNKTWMKSTTEIQTKSKYTCIEHEMVQPHATGRG